ncbi:hypothetical protein COCVIDRAFT_31788 [Bipolaris victoriae FI3]|uniref:WSC domain-containing protein n=1 Tax=Bipolaris victoriae (strain FI3) TaxID=930091 RepID=W7EA26_BIPV3|nr:hypothetical protein COCVIDRAFT_31788 [Bipolaris victoriae FI3]
MAKPHWSWARRIYFPITTIILLSAVPIWAQSYDGDPSNLARSKFQDPSRISPITTGPTLEPSLLPLPRDVRLRPRDVTAVSVDGYDYQGCVGDDGNKRVLGGPSINIVSLEPTLCGNFCSRSGYTIFGVQFATQCYCGNVLATTTMTTPPSCTTPCPGDSNAVCGGFYAMNVYSATITLDTVTDTSTMTVSPVVLPTATASLTTIVSSSSATSSTQAPRPTSNNDVTLPKAAIIGIGAGSALGAVLICAVIYYIWFYRRRQRSRKISNEAASSAGQWPPVSEQGGSGGPGNEAAMAKQPWAISEHSSRDLRGLGENPRQGFLVEAPGDYRQTHELPEGR